MVEKPDISAALRRQLFIVKIDVPQNHSTIKLCVKVVFYVTRLYATAGMSRYRLINVAPTGLALVMVVVVVVAWVLLFVVVIYWGALKSLRRRKAPQIIGMRLHSSVGKKYTRVY